MDLAKAIGVGGGISFGAITLLPKVLPQQWVANPWGRAALMIGLGLGVGYGLHKVGMGEAGIVAAGVLGGGGLVIGLSNVLAANAPPPAPPATPAALAAVELGSTYQLGAVYDQLSGTYQLDTGAVELGHLRAVELGAIEMQMEDADFGY